MFTPTPTHQARSLARTAEAAHSRSGCRSGARQPFSVSTAKVPESVFRPDQRGVTSLLRDARPGQASAPTPPLFSSDPLNGASSTRVRKQKNFRSPSSQLSDEG